MLHPEVTRVSTDPTPADLLLPGAEAVCGGDHDDGYEGVRSGILTLLPKSESMGVIGIDGKEYPIPILWVWTMPFGPLSGQFYKFATFLEL
jgi:hypothetical protein